jgi:hypothetical protein
MTQLASGDCEIHRIFADATEKMAGTTRLELATSARHTRILTDLDSKRGLPSR